MTIVADRRAVEIIDAGWSTTVQDRGRPGLAHLGVAPSGAVDPDLAGLVNRLVGNGLRVAVLETCGNLAIRAIGPLLVASSAELAPVSLDSGDVYRVPAGHGRLWHYLAVGGGVATPEVLGSRSTDTMAGLGTTDLSAGDLLSVGADSVGPVVADVAPLHSLQRSARVTPGPRTDWFAASAWDLLTATEWTVSASSRVGVRLSGSRLTRTNLSELASEGLVRGAIQVPPDLQPVMLLADHPTTGGYPVLAVVHPDDVATVAQHAPGMTIQFRSI